MKIKLTCSGSFVFPNFKRKKTPYPLNFWSIATGCSRTRMAYKVFPCCKYGRTPWADWLAFPPLSGWWMCFAHREFSDEISIIKLIFPNRLKYTHLSLTQPTVTYFRSLEQKYIRSLIFCSNSRMELCAWDNESMKARREDEWPN